MFGVLRDGQKCEKWEMCQQGERCQGKEQKLSLFLLTHFSTQLWSKVLMMQKADLRDKELLLKWRYRRRNRFRLH